MSASFRKHPTEKQTGPPAEQAPHHESFPTGVQDEHNGHDTVEVQMGSLSPEDDALVEQLVTEDDTPVDNLFSAKQQRLLVETLYTSWSTHDDGTPRVFLADTNVGLFYAVRKPPLVPDAFLSLGVRPGKNIWEKRNRSYFLWEYRKPPEVVIEVVSNREGEEDGRKLTIYAQIGVQYYAIYDPDDQLREGLLRIYTLCGKSYVPMARRWLPKVGLGLTLWNGVYEGFEDVWLRWVDQHKNVLPTGAEQARQEREQARRAVREREQAFQRAERLAGQLRAMGIDPDAENGY